jgi:hypothetical protein
LDDSVRSEVDVLLIVTVDSVDATVGGSDIVAGSVAVFSVIEVGSAGGSCNVGVESATGSCVVVVESATGSCVVEVVSTTGSCDIEVASTTGSCVVEAVSTAGSCVVEAASSTTIVSILVVNVVDDSGSDSADVGDDGVPVTSPAGVSSLAVCPKHTQVSQSVVA